MDLRKLWDIVKDGEDWHAAVHGITKSWTPPTNSATTSGPLIYGEGGNTIQ